MKITIEEFYNRLSRLMADAAESDLPRAEIVEVLKEEAQNLEDEGDV